MRGRWLMRLHLVACQAAAIGLTWNLWRVRTGDSPPNLPVFESAVVERLQIDFGWPLLASLALAVIWPGAGIVAHCVLLAVAIAMDQMRIQPEFISLAILLVGTLAVRGLVLIARCHLVSLWIFAGLHKLVCSDYLFDAGPTLAKAVFADITTSQAITLGVLAAFAELATGLLAVLPITRRATPWLALLLHVGILASLVVQQWNTAVWPWNIALAAAGFAFFRFHQPLLSLQDSAAKDALVESMVPKRRLGPVVLWTLAALFVLFYPALYYIDRCDAYVAWCVYSNNTPEGHFYPGGGAVLRETLRTGGNMEDLDLIGFGGESLLFRDFDAINVPFPPMPRLYRQYLRRLGEPDDAIVVDDPRIFVRWRGRARLLLVKQANGTIEEVVVAPPPPAIQR